ncbi:hypothetical protein D3C76_1546200 [compost metagenome]
MALVPTPLIGQALEQPALPAVASCAVQAAEFLVDLQVKAAPCQLQPPGFTARLQVAFDAPVNHYIGIERVEVEVVGEYRLFIVQAQAAYGGVFAGVNLGQQQLEQ